AVASGATYRLIVDGNLYETVAANVAYGAATGVLTVLEAQLEADGYVVTVVTTDGQNALRISKGANQAFAVALASITPSDPAKATTTAAGESRHEVREVRYSDAVPVVAGQRYLITINTTPFSVTAVAG